LSQPTGVIDASIWNWGQVVAPVFPARVDRFVVVTGAWALLHDRLDVGDWWVSYLWVASRRDKDILRSLRTGGEG